MNPEMGSQEARDNFRDMLDAVAAGGDHFTITRYDKPVAVVVPWEWYEDAKRFVGEMRPQTSDDLRNPAPYPAHVPKRREL